MCVWMCLHVQVKYAIKFASASRASVHLPEGAKGDMCRAVQSDVEFGRWFLTGPNPVMIRRCTQIPTDRFPVSDEMLLGLLDRTRRLADEARVITPCLYCMQQGAQQSRETSAVALHLVVARLLSVSRDIENEAPFSCLTLPLQGTQKVK